MSSSPSGDALPPDDQGLIARRYADEERAVLLRFLRLAKGERFQIAAVEAQNPYERGLLVEWLGRTLPERRFVVVSLRAFSGKDLVEELKRSIEAAGGLDPRVVVVLTELEEAPEVAGESRPALFAQLNLQRDLLVRELPGTFLLCAHPHALLRLRTAAPDFFDYVSPVVRLRADDSRADPPIVSRASMGPSATLERSEADWPSLLRAADQAIVRWNLDEARDLLAQFRLSELAKDWTLEAELLHVAMIEKTRGPRVALAEARTLLERLTDAARPQTHGKILEDSARFHRILGEDEPAISCWRQAEDRYRTSGCSTGIAAVQLGLAVLHRDRMELERALALAREARQTFRLHERRTAERYAIEVMIAILDQQGSLDEAQALCTREMLPLSAEIGDEHGFATSRSLFALLLANRGDLDGALRIFREEVLPVYARHGDEHGYAMALNYVAELLQTRGEIDEALRIRRDEELPVYTRRGDDSARGATLLQIANLLAWRGQFEESLRSLRDALTIYEANGRARECGVTRLNTGAALSSRGRWFEAVAEGQAARDLLDRHGSSFDQVEARLALSQTLYRIGNVAGAERELYDALDRADVEAPDALVRAAEALLGGLLTLRRVEEARSVYDRVSLSLSAAGKWNALARLDPLATRIQQALRAPPVARRTRPPRRRR